MAYVYLYLDPRITPPEPIYVGKGTGKRLSFHKTRAKNPILKEKIKHIKDAGLEPIIQIIYDNISDIDAMNLEKELILKYGRIHLGTGTLCNLTEGGEGTIGFKHSEKTKKLLSKQRKGKKQTPAQYIANCNRIVSDETKEKQRMANKGHKRHTPEQIQKIIETNKIRTISDETKILWSKQRLGKNEKIEWSPDNELLLKVKEIGFSETAKLFNTCYSNVKKRLKRRNLL